jgi:hypothetical protein
LGLRIKSGTGRAIVAAKNHNAKGLPMRLFPVRSIAVFFLLLYSPWILHSCARAEDATEKQQKLCTKYELDCPITVNKDSPWIDRKLVEALVLELLKKNDAWVGRVFYDGTTVSVYGTKPGKPGLEPTKQEQKQFTADYEKRATGLLDRSFPDDPPPGRGYDANG